MTSDAKLAARWVSMALDSCCSARRDVRRPAGWQGRPAGRPGLPACRPVRHRPGRPPCRGGPRCRRAGLRGGRWRHCPRGRGVRRRWRGKSRRALVEGGKLRGDVAIVMAEPRQAPPPSGQDRSACPRGGGSPAWNRASRARSSSRRASRRAPRALRAFRPGRHCRDAPRARPAAFERVMESWLALRSISERRSSNPPGARRHRSVRPVGKPLHRLGEAFEFIEDHRTRQAARALAQIGEIGPQTSKSWAMEPAMSSRSS